MTASDDDLPDELFIDIDDVSMGLYVFPLAGIELKSIPVLPMRQAVTARRTDEGYLLTGERSPIRGGVRFRPHNTPPVMEWLRMSRHAAWSCFVAAIPSFWLSRHRLNNKLREQLQRDSGVLDIRPLAEKRMRHREQLEHHQASLRLKTWAIRYHRDQFRKAVALAREGRQIAQGLMAATHEFVAHDGAIYGLLDEASLLLNLMHRIARGIETPTSFSDLKKYRHTSPAMQKLFSDLPWYEPFHARRTGAAHAFTPLISRSADDFRLFQRPHPKYSKTTPEESDLGAVEALLDATSTGFDRFLTDLAVLLLEEFHSFDTLQLSLKEREEDSLEEITVWARGLAFSEALPPGQEIYLDAATGEVALSYTHGASTSARGSSAIVPTEFR